MLDLKQAGHSRVELDFPRLFGELNVPLTPLLLYLPTDVQSDGWARQCIKGFAEYLAISSCREASSVVQSQLAENEKLEPTPGSVLCKANVP